MKKTFLTLTLFVMPNIIFCMNKKTKKEHALQSNAISKKKGLQHLLSQSDNSLIIREKEECPTSIITSTPQPSRKLQVLQNHNKIQRNTEIRTEKIEIFKGHMNCHENFDSSRQFVLDPDNRAIIAHCFECLELHNLLCSINTVNSF